MSVSVIFEHIGQLVTLNPSFITPENPLGIIEDAALLSKNGVIAWLGPQHAWPKAAETFEEAETFQGADERATVNLRGKTVFPGLIDSHTHPVFAGNRANEFELRLQGKTYLEIAAQGGGILKTVEATRQASEDELLTLAEQRIQTMLSFGVTTVEAKSGYGLDWPSELKSLRVLQRLKTKTPVDIRPTYMGAHDIPPEFKGRTDAYVDLLCTEHLPRVATQALAEFCDVFCETGYFSVAQSRRILETAQALGFKRKVHAEEFSDLGGAALAAELGAVSADHLLHLSDAGITALRHSQTVATLLPGTAFFLRLGRYAPAKKLLEAGVPVALATDFNPGSCMSENLQLTMTIACLQMGMTPSEVIPAVTLNAAKALGLAEDRGSLVVGKRTDLTVFACPTYHEILYHMGVNQVCQVWITGQQVFCGNKKPD